MTGAELKAYVTHILFEAPGLLGTGLWDEVSLSTTVSIANQKVWQKVINVAAALFAKRSADKTYVAATGKFDLSGAAIDVNGVYRVLSVQLKQGDAYYPINPIIVQDAPLYETSNVFGWYQEGDDLYLSPAPTANQTFRMVYVPNLPILNDLTQALGGKLVTYHPLVAYEAAIVLAVKDEARVADFKLLRDELLSNLVVYLSRRHKQSARSIRAIQP